MICLQQPCGEGGQLHFINMHSSLGRWDYFRADYFIKCVLPEVMFASLKSISWLTASTVVQEQSSPPLFFAKRESPVASSSSSTNLDINENHKPSLPNLCNWSHKPSYFWPCMKSHEKHFQLIPLWFLPFPSQVKPCWMCWCWALQSTHLLLKTSCPCWVPWNTCLAGMRLRSL